MWDVALAVTDPAGARVLVADGGLPHFAPGCDEGVRGAAEAAARRLGARPPHGILAVRHMLDVDAADEAQHRAVLRVTYAAVCDGAAAPGCEWARVAACDARVQTLLAQPVLPVGLVAAEGDEP